MSEAYEYRVEVRTTIRKVLPNGAWTNDQLTLEDNMSVGALSRVQLAQLLVRFHDLTQAATEGLTGA